MVQATACFGFTMTNGFQSIQWIGAATRAIAGGASKHFMITSVTRRLAGTLGDTAGTLTWPATGCNHWICFTVANGIQGAKWICSAAFAIRAGTAEYFVQSLVTGRDTLCNTAGTLVQTTTCFSFTVADGLKGIKWIGSAA